MNLHSLKVAEAVFMKKRCKKDGIRFALTEFGNYDSFSIVKTVKIENSLPGSIKCNYINSNNSNSNSNSEES